MIIIRTLEGHKDLVCSLIVLPNENLASGSHREIKIWDTDIGNEMRTLEGHTDVVNNLVVLPNGFLASASKDKTIKIRNTDIQIV